MDIVSSGYYYDLFSRTRGWTRGTSGKTNWSLCVVSGFSEGLWRSAPRVQEVANYKGAISLLGEAAVQRN